MPHSHQDSHAKPRISATAWFTAAVWARYHFDAAEIFDTTVGQSWVTACDWLLRPAKLFRPGMGHFLDFLALRHRMFEQRLNQLHPGLVIEIGAGLSSRGFALASSSSAAHYIELDLPAVVEAKRRCLRNCFVPRNYHLLTGDLMASNLAERVPLPASFASPVVVITEGVCDYLSFAEKRRAWRQIANLLARVGGGHYLLDVNPRERFPASHLEVATMVTGLSWLFTGHSFGQRFYATVEDAVVDLRSSGFDSASILDPVRLGGRRCSASPDDRFFDVVEALGTA